MRPRAAVPASAMAWCACRSASKRPRTWSRTSKSRWTSPKRQRLRGAHWRSARLRVTWIDLHAIGPRSAGKRESFRGPDRLARDRRLDEAREECLAEIFGIVRAAAAAAGMTEER